MKKLFLLIPSLLIAGILFTSCQEEPTLVEPGKLNLVIITETGESFTTIWAGQNIAVGKVTLVDIDTNNDGLKDALQVKYEMTLTPWVITAIHFAVVTESGVIPQTKKGNLIPGQFGYKFENLGGLAEYTFTIPFTEFDFDCDPLDLLHAAAHCVVGIPDGFGGYTQTETGWGFGDDTPGNNWAMTFSFNINCDINNPPPPGSRSETAFAKACDNDAKCFLDIPDLNANRWGWTNGPFEDYGTYTFPIFAGAGQCSGGTIVGELIVDYDGSTAEVTFTTCEPFTMDETHLYVGCDILPGVPGDYIVAPGQYPFKEEHNGGVTTFTYTVENLNCLDGIYVVAHAVVVGPLGTWTSCRDAECDFEGQDCVAEKMYGTINDNTGDIYEIDPNTGVTTRFLDISTKTVSPSILPLNGSSPNANAVDQISNRFYFATFNSPGSPANTTTAKSNLYFVDLDDATKTIVYAGQLGAHASDAAFFNGSYFYIGHGTKTLKEVTFTETGTIDDEISRGEITTNFTNQYFGFGDIAIDCDGILYLAATVRNSGDVIATYLNAKYDISGSSISTMNETTVTATNFWNQIAFGDDNGTLTLYSHNTGTGQFYKIDAITGLMTATVLSTLKFTDLGSAVGRQ